jgi:hypothetical protein
MVVGARPVRRNTDPETAAAGTPPLERVYLTSVVEDFARESLRTLFPGPGPGRPRRAWKM